MAYAPMVLHTEVSHWPNLNEQDRQLREFKAAADQQHAAQAFNGRWKVLATLYGIMVLAGISVAQFGGLMSWIAYDLNLNSSQSGMTQTAFFFGFLFGSLAIGSAVARSSAKQLLPAMCLLLGAGSVLCSVPMFYTILVGRTLAGAGLAGGALLTTILICTMFPNLRATLLSIMHGIVAISAAGTLFLARPIAEMMSSWSATLFLSGTLALVVGGLAILLRYPSLSGQQPASMKQLMRVMRHPALLAVIPAALGYLVAEQALTMFLPTLGETHFHSTPALAGALGGVFWVGIILGRFLGPVLVIRLSESWVIIGGGLVMGLGVVAAICSPTMWLAMVFVALAGAGGGPIVPMISSYISRQIPDQQSAAQTAIQIAVCSGGLLGPLLVGTLGQQLGLLTGLAVAAVLVANNVLPMLFAAATSGNRSVAQVA